MYGRKQFEHEMQAVDAADSCISAAIAGSDYKERLIPYLDDYYNIATYFWARCPITKKKLEQAGRDAEDIAGIFVTLCKGEHFGGLQSKVMTAGIERVRRKLKGKLFMTRVMLSDKDKNNCDDEKNHRQPCACHAFNLFKLAEAREARQ